MFMKMKFGWYAIIVSLLCALPLGSNRPVSWLFFCAVILCLFTMQTVRDLLSPPVATPVRTLAPPAFALLIVIAWSLIQAAPDMGALAHPLWALLPGGDGVNSISATPASGPLFTVRLAAYCALFWLVASFGMESENAKSAMRLIATGGGALCLYGVVTVATGVNPILGDEFNTRYASASFINRNHFATWAVFAALANLACLTTLTTSIDQEEEEWTRRRNMVEMFMSSGWIYLASFAICITALAASQSRAGAVSGLAGMLIYWLMVRRRNSGGPVMKLAFIILGLIALFATSGVLSRFLSGEGEGLRFLVYPLEISAILERPFLGHGLGSFEEVFRAFVSLEASSAEWTAAHNSYLGVIFELGAPAALLMFAAIGLIVLKIARGVKERRRNWEFPAAALASAVAAGLHALFDFSLEIPAVAALFTVMLGLGWAQSFRASDRHQLEKIKSRRSSRRTAASRPV